MKKTKKGRRKEDPGVGKGETEKQIEEKEGGKTSFLKS